ncbi:MAG: PEP-CTERM sorting domain-containing protein [Thauera sp.]|nr:MAG: PEP-CTERM sorting domain-containing protein [Thauera sp.]
MKTQLIAGILTFCGSVACSHAAPLTLSDWAADGTVTTVRFANHTPRANGMLNAGGFVSSIPGSLDPLMQSFVSWCIDIFQPAHIGATVSDYSQVSLAQYGSLSAERGAMLGNLASIAYDQSRDSSVYSGAFQLAVWEIVNETSAHLNLSNGTFKTFNANDNSIELAQQWLNALPQQQSRFGFNIFASPTAQDVIHFFELPPPAAAEPGSVPEPGALALIALAGAAAVATRRRRALAA